MATQAAIFAETIAGMKKAVKRKVYDSDSDSSIEQLTNRGNKLRKKARFVHEGQLAPPTGPQVYKRRIEHAGFQRDIISRNPPLIDEDGYEVDSEDDDERAQEAIAAAAEFNPYAEVRIEHLLAPLTAASDLPDHPTLSKPFTSKTLTELTLHAGEMVQKEKASLWRIKHLLTRLSGDCTWIPCESVETGNDIALFNDDRDRNRGNQLGKSIAKDEGDQMSTGTLMSDEAEAAGLLMASEGAAEAPVHAGKEMLGESPADGDVTMASGDEPKMTKDAANRPAELADIPKLSDRPEGNSARADGDRANRKDSEIVIESSMEIDQAAGPVATPKPDSVTESQAQVLDIVELADTDEVAEDQEEFPAPRRMRTRAQAQAASDNTATSRTRSATPESSNESFIHPYFLAPVSSHPDRDVGLPQHEAEETRRLLQLYIQKQEEVCRGAQRVYEGLLRADRYRHLVLKWAKAEAHVGLNRDMSDGEDWYDKEEWGLEEDLKKGQDEEEEDAATTAKKTRTRRQ